MLKFLFPKSSCEKSLKYQIHFCSIVYYDNDKFYVNYALQYAILHCSRPKSQNLNYLQYEILYAQLV